MGIIWDELTVLFMCLLAKQKYRLEKKTVSCRNALNVFCELNVHNLNWWTWALLIPTKVSDPQTTDTAEADWYK